ncbi:MAG: hypothetical protein AABX05_02895 [Nanoarchaeota archaeon]
MKGKNYNLNDRLDLALNNIVSNPDVPRLEFGYNTLEREVEVLIEAPGLKSPIEGAERLDDGLYATTVSVDYLQELAGRDDIAAIYSVPKSKLKK